MRCRMLLVSMLAVLGCCTLPVSTAVAAPTSPATAAGATTTPVKHFVYLMQGDRSFDNYFGTYPGADGIPANTCQKRVVTGPDKNCVKPFPLHGKNTEPLGAGTVELDNQYDEGRMDGFVAAFQNQGRDGAQAMGYYDQRDLPTYWGLAGRYVLFDKFFSSTRSGERVNRSYWVSGAAPPAATGAATATGYAAQLTIFDRLQAAGTSWKFYVQGYDPKQNYQTASKTNPTTQTVRVPLLNYPRFVNDPELSSHIVDLSQYYKDLDSGQLPAVSYIASSGPSERSARSISSGQKLVTDLVGALMVSKSWNSSAFLLSYDGSGGWYDHVAPPRVDAGGYGMRVPALLISPYASTGTVNSNAFDYTCALAFIEQNWKLAPLASRDASAKSLATAFNFDSPPQPPQLQLAEPGAARAPLASVSFVYFCYGAALLMIVGLVAFAAWSTASAGRASRPKQNAEPIVAQSEPVGAGS